MTNEEYINKNKAFLSAIEEGDNKFVDWVNQLDDSANLPYAGSFLSKKINDLLDLFKDDVKPIDQHLIVIMESMYLHALYSDYIDSVKKHYNTVVTALSSNDDRTLANALKEGIDKKRKWEWITNAIQSFDFMDNLDDVLDSGIWLPKNMTKEESKVICLRELDAVSYTPDNSSSFSI